MTCIVIFFESGSGRDEQDSGVAMVAPLQAEGSLVRCSKGLPGIYSRPPQQVSEFTVTEIG